jgi:hypothetical protein
MWLHSHRGAQILLTQQFSRLDILVLYYQSHTLSDHVFIILLLLQPDITAPRVGIIAAYGGSECGPFIKMPDTSMACPHVTGVATLLRFIYPKWSPAAIKSAIMTTDKGVYCIHFLYFYYYSL